ncbi:MAG: hypothetical protein HY554_17165, partial [Elusimicrobia bacterium]|nr:hypothetical protein [Elusimicrobiota bacterium]
MDARRTPAALGLVAGVLLAASAFLPYWQARLFAPQYREGLTATMYLHKVGGDLQEIDLLNHYVGMASLGSLAVWERRLALPGLALLVLLCLVAFRQGCPAPSWLKVAPVAAFPFIFVADMKFWMIWATTHLDKTAPLKLKPFAIPVLGVGKVAQFRSELGPMPGFGLAVLAALLLLAGLWLTRRRGEEAAAPGSPARATAIVAALLLALAGAAAAQTTPLQPLLDAAAAGATVELQAGVYDGPGVVDKPLRLTGRGAVIDGGGRGTVLTIRAAGAAVEGLTLRGSGDSLLGED